jgi:CRISPR-associated endonuclease/helicase Cas3
MTDGPIPGVQAAWHSYLAKSEESLVTHTWYVLSRLADQRCLHPDLAAHIGQPDVWHVLYWAAFLHDFGKVARGFQHSLKAPQQRWGHRHEVLSLAFVDWLFPAGDAHRPAVIAAIACHHKDALEIVSRYGKHPGLDPEDDPATQLVAEIDDSARTFLHAWLTTCGPHWADQLGFAADLRPIRLPPAPPPISAASIHRAVSTLRDFTKRITFRDDPAAARYGLILRGLIQLADHAGSADSRREPFPTLPLSPDIAAALLPSDARPHPHQAAAADSAAGSAMLIAPTGSGKTEAALLWLQRQAAHDGHAPARTVYVLPYQASMNAMRERLKKTWPDSLIGLQHGHAAQALYLAALAADPEQDEKAAADLARLNEEISRLYRHPLSVQSPYQLLKSPYQLKGHETLFSSLHGGRFILDEIHAYEPNRLALIVTLIGFLHRQAAARFFIMSATLPGHVQRVLAAALPGLHTITAAPETFAAFQRHRVHVLDGALSDPDNIARIVADARAGKAVLVCCNTVRRAIELYDLIRAELPDHTVILAHSRFKSRDRIDKEQAILAQVGLGVATGGLRPIVVATQVIEVSLNIDMDTIYSEAAPLEALIQRFGRVNRKQRVPLADCYIVREQPEQVKHIYEVGLIAAALAKLESLSGSAIDEGQVSAWLDEIYSGTALEAWQAAYDRAAAEFQTAILETLQPFNTDDDLEAAFYRLFDGLEVLPEADYSAYKALIQQHKPLEASLSLIPLRWGQYQQLQRHNRAWRETIAQGKFKIAVYLVAVPYSPERGLDLEAATRAVPALEAD